jgi:DNA mismatch repair protein MutS2
MELASLAALDWPALLEALSGHARTPRGRRAALALTPLRELADVTAALDAVEEVLHLEKDGATVPVAGVDDVAPIIARAAKGAVLDKAELRQCGSSLSALDHLGAWLADAETPILHALAPGLRVDPYLRDTLAAAFDPTGDLSALQWPILGDLRRRIADLHLSVRRTLDELVKGDDLKDALQDRYVTQRGDRYVLPVKVGFKRKDMGIVHGVSGSGQTAFIEPTAIIGLNNELRLAEGELEATERRILTQLSEYLGRLAAPLTEALDTAEQLDLHVARAGLARALDATRPLVRRDGVVKLTGARHPLLALRRVGVVPNDLTLTTSQPFLVISGPNTGGKTVALKTLGLCALLVSIGAYVPAAEGSRVDLFHTVSALIGDHQTVQGDQSSFSSHLAALRLILRDARPGCLVLVDEIASGTDPQQGAALAHALMEALVDAGARGVITTHFHRLKTLGATDSRFAMGGMQFAQHRPTFRLQIGASGESHALSVAERLAFPPALLERARVLMGEEERSLAAVLTALDEQRARAEAATARAEAMAIEVAAERDRLAAQEAKIRERARQLEQEHAAAFVKRLAAADAAIGAVVAGLQAQPSHRKVDAARATVDALRAVAPKPIDAITAAPTVAAPGDRVRVRSLGQVGDVREVSGDHAQVQIGAMTLRVALTDLEPAKGARRPKPAAPHRDDDAPARRASLGDAVRYDGNTLDLRGERVDEGLDKVEAFFSRARMSGHTTVFLLHGHGTGAMKTAVRRWLPGCALVSAWQPADASQGGDAYTVAALR